MLNSNPRVPKYNNHLMNSFTLIELLVVIVMIAILLAMGLWVLISARQTRSLPTVADKVGGIFTLLKGFSGSPSREMTDFCQPGEANVNSAVIDEPKGYAYLGTNQMPAQIIKVNLNTFKREATITLSSGEGRLQSAVIDQQAGFAYFGTNDSPAKIIKIDIDPTHTFQKVKTLPLRSGENNLMSAVTDGNYAYFAGGQAGAGGKFFLARINLTDFSEYPTTLFLPRQIDWPVLDQSTHIAYFGGPPDTDGISYINRINLVSYTLAGTALKLSITGSKTGTSKGVLYKPASQPNSFLYYNVVSPSNQVHLVKIDLATFTEKTANVFTFSDNEQPNTTRSNAIVDQNYGFAYFAIRNVNVNKIVKIDLNTPTPIKVGSSLILNSNIEERQESAMIIDQNKRFLYPVSDSGGGQYTAWTAPTAIYKINLDDFSIKDKLTLDQNNNFAYALKEIGLVIYSPPSGNTRFAVTLSCANDSPTAYIFQGTSTSFLGDINIPKNIQFIDSNGNQVWYYIGITSANQDAKNIGNVIISIIDSRGNKLATNLSKMRMTDGSGIYYDIYIANNGSVSVKKE